MSKNIVLFSEVGKEDGELVGGKGANLGELTKAGFPVPPGYIITSTAYFDYLKATKLEGKIRKILKDLDFEDTKELQKRAQECAKLIMATPLPKSLEKEIVESYHKLKADTHSEKLFVAVRSSATAEDLAGASFAGQQATYLNVIGDKNVLKAVLKCWASLFEARAIYYRNDQGFDQLSVGIAVPIQKMVNSEQAGVMFTVDPTDNNYDHVSIEAAYGLGEVVVLGAVTPDRYLIAKKTREIVSKEIAKQTWMLTRKSGSTDTDNLDDLSKAGEPVPTERQDKQKIDDKTIFKLFDLAMAIEKHYGKPQDTEWATEGGKVYMVQSRPVTTLGDSKPEDESETGKEDTKKTESADISKAKVLLEGAAASVGMASGNVVVIHSPSEIDKIKEGDVLVTEMTTPDYVPAMKRAVGIVTDKGGRTCFGGETKILTNKGFKKIREIVFSTEELFTPSINRQTLKIEWKKIVDGFEKKSGAYQVTISQTGNSKTNLLTVTPDHKMITIENRKLIDKTMEEILESDRMILTLNKLSSFKNKFRFDQALAYFLGGIGTDGSVYLNRTHGEVQFIQKLLPEKMAFIETMQSSLNQVYGKTFSMVQKPLAGGIIRGKQVWGQAAAFRCYSKDIATKVRNEQHNLTESLLNADEKTLLNFLGGVIDGDGSFNQKTGRIQIYCSKEYLLDAIIVACLKLGFAPQVVENRTIKNIQIVDRVGEILSYTKRVKGSSHNRKFGTNFFGAKALFSDIVDEVNYKGRIKPYVNKNLLLDKEKIMEYIYPLLPSDLKKKIKGILGSGLGMQRVTRVSDIKSTEVYNIEVEDNHNYFVFTEGMTPVLVNNCHAAIVSRELGIPCVVGTDTATTKLKGAGVVTVDGKNGVVYAGNVVPKEKTQEGTVVPASITESKIITATKLYVILAEPELAEKIAAEDVDGVGLLRAEFIIAEEIKEHPKKMLEEKRGAEFTEKLSQGLEKFAAAFHPRPVVYRFTDFKTNEYRNLPGGEKYEPEEENPMIGYRGCFRYHKDPEVFKLEIEAIKKVREKYNNLHVMVPFVRTIDEFRGVRKIMADSGLSKEADPSFKLWIMVEVPSAVILIDDFAKEGIDGVSIGSNDLTQLTLGLDRDSSVVAEEFDERNPAVLWMLERTVKGCRKAGITCSICGQAPSVYPEITQKLVEWGATSVSVMPDVLYDTRKLIAEVEERQILNELSSVQKEIDDLKAKLDTD